MQGTRKYALGHWHHEHVQRRGPRAVHHPLPCPPGEAGGHLPYGVVRGTDEDQLTRVHHLLGRGVGNTTTQPLRQPVCGRPCPARHGYNLIARLPQGHSQGTSHSPRSNDPDRAVLTEYWHLPTSSNAR